MTVLFSPIGTADPMTQLGDGPMLHIVRHYRPDRIYLFLSPKMADYQDADQRYTRAIELLYQSLGEPLPNVELIRSQNVEAHRFDTFIREYEDCLGRILKECHIKRNGEKKILVNASSGTPAMEQAAVALGALGWLPLQLIQVPTPRGGTNKKDDRESPDDYDLDVMWALYGDKDKDSWRGIPVELPNFRDRIIRENVIELVNSYDYEAALRLAKKSEYFPRVAINKIADALDRLNLKNPGKDRTDKLAGYLSVLEVKCERGQWADFVLGLTPVLMETMERVLERDAGLPREKYLQKGTNKVNLSSVERDERLCRLFSWYMGKAGSQFLTNRTLIGVIDEYCTDKTMVQKLHKIRTFEDQSRNSFAHELCAVDQKTIEREGRATFEEVMQLLFEVNGLTRLRGRFDLLNREIVNLVMKG